MSIERYWYDDNWRSRLLLPLSVLFRALAAARRGAFRLGLLRTHRLPVPVVVVGNISVGGTGKTPLVTWLVDYLKRQGLRPGIISRGYGGRAQQWPQPVDGQSEPSQIGDEPLLLARRCGCPLWVGPDRVAAARAMLAATPVDIIISDDGLQHYALGRDLEIAVVDGRRRLGNGRCLPAGPLREPPTRLHRVDLIVSNGAAHAGEYSMTLAGDTLYPLNDARYPLAPRPLASLRGATVHALAGIGDPQRFFATLREAGLDLIEHPFADHHPYQAHDLIFNDKLPVLMTEKDAVKCRAFAAANHWYLPVNAQLPDGFGPRLMTLLSR